MRRSLLLSMLVVPFLATRLVAADQPPEVSTWLATSLHRVFPASAPGGKELSLLAPRNGRIAFQACVRNTRRAPLPVECSIRGADDLKPVIRFVGLVPM